jgi:hypothetical protein
LGVRGGGEGWGVWSANLAKICLGLLQDLPSKRDKGAVVMLLQCKGKKKRWPIRAWFTWSVCKRVRENKREEKKRIRSLAEI